VAAEGAGAEAPPLHAGDIITSKKQRYLLLRIIGHGTFGVCWLAKGLTDSRLFTLKMAKFTTKNVENLFLSEAATMMALAHPHLLSLEDSFRCVQRVVLVSEWCALQDLRKLVLCAHRQRQHLEDAFIAKVLLQLTLALSYMHAQSYVHRDIKLANVFISTLQDIKLGDFGSSRRLNTSSGLMTSTLTGTPLYMAPEVFHRQPYSFPSDIWSLGALLYEMLTLHPLFNAKSVRSLQEKRGPIQDNPEEYIREVRDNLGYGEEVVDLLTLMLEPVPDKRLTVRGVLDHPFLAPHLATLVASKEALLLKVEKSLAINQNLTVLMMDTDADFAPS
jgi:serine/threonine protein kinase